jgi:uncharacterized hydrophobic protein (TIGR00271 family)
VIVPADDAERVLAELRHTPSVINLARLPGVAIEPPGDLIFCDVPREDASVVVDHLCALGVDDRGSISIEEVATTVSRSATAAAHAAIGSASDAVIWEEVEARTSESADLSFGFLAFMILATLIAAIGILTDSQILIIGAMVVGPEFGPLAGLCVALVERRGALARRSARALLIGFPVAIAITIVAVLILRWTGAAPGEIAAHSRPATYFISHPDTFSVLVALLAGTAGVLSLTTAKSGALIGVLISVTTIPAAGNVAVAVAYRDWTEARGALEQLLINLGCLVLAGTATLALQRSGFRRRLRRAG